MSSLFFFFFNDTATTEIYTLSLHDALPISRTVVRTVSSCSETSTRTRTSSTMRACLAISSSCAISGASTVTSLKTRSEEHTSELQSRQYLVCRLLLEKKKKTSHTHISQKPA